MDTEKFAEQVQELKQSLIDEGAKRHYIDCLKTFDWFYEASDEHRVYLNGKTDLAVLHAMQEKIDPTGEIWMTIRPDDFMCPLPKVKQ